MRGLLLLTMVALAAPAGAQTAAATIVYHFERVGVPVPNYTFTVHEDGSGSYQATYQSAAKDGGAPTETTTAIMLTPATAAKLFQEIRSTDHFRSRCESKAKNVADTGAKTIDYSGPDGHATCTYNYTENKAVEAVTDTFGGIANTLNMGHELEFVHRYDRLGLDALMTVLVASLKDRSALEVQTIAPVLQSIAGDGQVIERVRVAAGKLLQMGAGR